MGKLCRHCQRGLVNRPRGLCWSCYYKPGVRDQYPSESIYARRGVGGNNQGVDPPPYPTDAIPGTDEKVAVMEWRAENGYALWHPGDTRRNLR